MAVIVSEVILNDIVVGTSTIDTTIVEVVTYEGIPGPFTEISIGEVTSGVWGEEPEVSVTGDAGTKDLNFKLISGPPNTLTVDTVSASDPGSNPQVTVGGTSPDQTISFVLPRGEIGPANELAVGTVSTLETGVPASASITGTYPDQELNLGLPKGNTGDTPTFTVGTVSSGSADVELVGTAPNYTMNFSMPSVSTHAASHQAGGNDDIGAADRATIGNLLTDGQALVSGVGVGGSGNLGNVSNSTGTATIESGEGLDNDALQIVSLVTATNWGGGIPRSTAGHPVTPGERFTASMALRTLVGTRRQDITVLFWTDAGAYVDGVQGQQYIAASSDWQTLSISGVVPATAAYVSIENANRDIGAIGDTVQMCRFGFWRGTGGGWVPPGIPVTNLITSTLTESVTNETLSRARPVVTNFLGAKTWTLPDADENYGVQFTLINRGSGTVTVNRGSNTVNGAALTPTIPGHGQLQIISTGDTWRVLSGEYSSLPGDVPTKGKASYVWDHSATGTNPVSYWRLVKYDSGVRWITDAEWPLPPGAAWSTASGNNGYLLRRINGNVTLGMKYFSLVCSGYELYSLTPDLNNTGFQAFTSSYAPVSRITDAVWYIRNPPFNGNGTVLLSAPDTSEFIAAGALSWMTAASLPTTLPGTQFTAPQ